VVMHAREATSRKRSREIAVMCMQIKGDESEFAASGEIRVEANKRAGRSEVECCQSPSFQLHIYEFDSETRCRGSQKSEISRGNLFFSFRDI